MSQTDVALRFNFNCKIDKLLEVRPHKADLSHLSSSWLPMSSDNLFLLRFFSSRE